MAETNRGTAMKDARKRAGLSMEKLSEISGISASCIFSYEHSYHYPTLPNLIALADALGISIDEYVGH